MGFVPNPREAHVSAAGLGPGVALRPARLVHGPRRAAVVVSRQAGPPDRRWPQGSPNQLRQPPGNPQQFTEKRGRRGEPGDHQRRHDREAPELACGPNGLPRRPGHPGGRADPFSGAAFGKARFELGSFFAPHLPFRTPTARESYPGCDGSGDCRDEPGESWDGTGPNRVTCDRFADILGKCRATPAEPQPQPSRTNVRHVNTAGPR